VFDWIARDKIARNTEATLRMLKVRLESATGDSAREALDLLRRPAFVSAIAVFFFVAAIFSVVVAGALVAPRSFLALVWRMKPQAQLDFASLGALGVAMMLALATATALTALGLWVGTRWGWRLAVTLLAVIAASDVVRVLMIDPRAASGILGVAVLLLSLAGKNVRRWCAQT
jgi:hypothetical protein